MTVHEIGRSRLGRPILAIEINNPETGPAAEKSGFYVDGNIHGGEVLGGEGALYSAAHPVHHALAPACELGWRKWILLAGARVYRHSRPER